MEVTTVSPSPVSPTEGDDLCEIDVTNVAIHSVTLLICLCGLAGNGAVIWLLGTKERNIIIFVLTVTDFLLLIFMVPSALLFLVEDISCSPIMPLLYLNLVFQLSIVSFYWGLILLLVLKDDIFVVSPFLLCCTYKWLERLIFVVGSVLFWVIFVFFTAISTVTSLCPSHEQEHCRAALISMYVIILLLFVAPVVISITINIIKAKCGSKKQPSQRKDIVAFIIMLFTLLFGLCNFLQQVGYIPVPTQVFFLITCIHSTIKPFIYFVAGRCWSPCSVGSLRLSLQMLFEEEEANPADSDDAPRDMGV